MLTSCRDNMFGEDWRGQIIILHFPYVYRIFSNLKVKSIMNYYTFWINLYHIYNVRLFKVCLYSEMELEYFSDNRDSKNGWLYLFLSKLDFRDLAIILYCDWITDENEGIRYLFAIFVIRPPIDNQLFKLVARFQWIHTEWSNCHWISELVTKFPLTLKNQFFYRYSKYNLR